MRNIRSAIFFAIRISGFAIFVPEKYPPNHPKNAQIDGKEISKNIEQTPSSPRGEMPNRNEESFIFLQLKKKYWTFFFKYGSVRERPPP